MFTDESHFFVIGNHSQFVRKSAEERLSASHLNQSVKHLQKKMFWDSFTWKGVGFLVPVKGMMNTDRYIDVLRQPFPDLKVYFQIEMDYFDKIWLHAIPQEKPPKFFKKNHV